MMSLFVCDRKWNLAFAGQRREWPKPKFTQMFSNAFGQTAETPRYAQARSGRRPTARSVIAKGGISNVHAGKHNGSVLRISPDGKSNEIIGYGLRFAVHWSASKNRPHYRERSAG